MTNPVAPLKTQNFWSESVSTDQKLKLLELLNEINLSISKELELNEVLRVTCQLLGQSLQCDRVAILVTDSDQPQELLIRGEFIQNDLTPQLISQLNTWIPISENPYLQVVLQHPLQVMATEDLPALPGLGERVQNLIQTFEIQSTLTIATCYRGAVNGVVSAQFCREPHTWQPWEAALLEGVARQLGIAIGQAQLYEKTRDAAQRESLLRSVTDQIRASSDIRTILQASVDGVRKLLRTDRVVVYQFQANWRGRVVVENIVPPWSSVLGDLGADDCFSGEYAQLYRGGRIRAIDDVETDARLDACHANFLRSIQVRANLIVPIVINAEGAGQAMPQFPGSQGRTEYLWGLLIAHQCSQPRHWRSQELRLMKQLADQLAIALRQAALYEQSKAQARRERLLRHSITQIRSSLDLDAILQNAVDCARNLLNGDRAVIYQFQPDWNGNVVVESVIKPELSLQHIDASDNCFQQTHADLYCQGRVRKICDVKTDPNLDDCHRQFLVDLSVRASVTVAILLLDPEVSESVDQSLDPNFSQNPSQNLTKNTDQSTIQSIDQRPNQNPDQSSYQDTKSSLDRTDCQGNNDQGNYQDFHKNSASVIQASLRKNFEQSTQNHPENGLTKDIDQNIYQNNISQSLRQNTSDSFHKNLDPSVDLMPQVQQQGLLDRVVPYIPGMESPPGQLWGLLIVYDSYQPRAWTDSDVAVLRQIADQAAIAIQQSELYAQTQRQAQELRATLDQLQATQQQLLRSEKLSSIGKMAGGLAHEINNANNFIFANLHYVRDYTSDLLTALETISASENLSDIEAIEDELDLNYIREDFPKLLNSMELGSNRIREIVAALQQFNNTDRVEWLPSRLQDCLENCLNTQRSRLTPNIRLQQIFEPIPPVTCSPVQIERAITSILSNAIDAIAARSKDLQKDSKQDPPKPTDYLGELNIHLHLDDRRDPPCAIISIRDNGIGIPPEIQSRIFDPFFTTKEIGQGTGLGLTTCYQIIVEGHGGTIDVSSVPGEETIVTLALPLNLPNPASSVV